jgi:hypothetical protein
VHAAVKGIALACVPQPDTMLYDLLTGAIGECTTWAGRAASPGTKCGTATWVPARESANTAVVH